MSVPTAEVWSGAIKHVTSGAWSFTDGSTLDFEVGYVDDVTGEDCRRWKENQLNDGRCDAEHYYMCMTKGKTVSFLFFFVD